MLQKIPGNPPTVLQGRAAARSAITMRGLLEWAYRTECVRFCEANPGDFTPTGGGMSGTAVVCRALELGFVPSGRGAGGGVYRPAVCHDDAAWVHGLVRSLDRDEFWLVVRHAEAGTAPEWEPAIEPARVVPILRGNGKPAMFVCPVERRPVACRIEVVGVSAEDAAAMRQAARDTWRQWWALLYRLRDRITEQDALTRWQVTGIGAEPEPWAKPAPASVSNVG